MKTSNSILLIFLLLLLLLPLAMILSIRRKIGTADYTEMHYGQQSRQVRRPLPRAGTLRVQSTYPFTLKCRLIPSDSAAYSFPDPGDDSSYLNMSDNHDTVSLVYAPRIKDEHPEERELRIDLHYSSWQRLEIDGAMVTIDSSWQDARESQVILKNQGQIRLGDGFNGRLNIVKGPADAAAHGDRDWDD